jgi:hypothetical protein
MAKRPVVPINPLVASKTRLHSFAHAGVSYEVQFHTVDGACFAMLYIAGSQTARPLHPYPDEIPAGLSADAIRSGYATVAEWLVKCDRWPVREAIAQHSDEGSIERAA